MTDKQELRRTLRARRAALPEDERHRRSAAACRLLADLPELHRADVVALYAALPTEADPGPVRAPLLGRGARIALPRVREDGHLELVEAVDGLVPGFRGVLEPAGPPLADGEVDVIVVPGVAFDADGGRLGQGGGHYDRLLASTDASVTAVGFAFSFQVVPHVPVLDHDRPVDVVVTDETVYRRAPRTGGPS